MRSAASGLYWRAVTSTTRAEARASQEVREKNAWSNSAAVLRPSALRLVTALVAKGADAKPPSRKRDHAPSGSGWWRADAARLWSPTITQT